MNVLAFRGNQGLHATLAHIDFNVRHAYVNWDRTAVVGSSELIMVARRP